MSQVPFWGILNYYNLLPVREGLVATLQLVDLGNGTRG